MLTLMPGDRGTARELREYGDRLICVRYRYDEKLKKRFKTVELKVDEIPWEPAPTDDDCVFIKVKWNEKDVQEQVKKAGGKWDKIRKLWKFPYGKVKALSLISRFAGIAQ
jgi:hypothetical protein